MLVGRPKRATAIHNLPAILVDNCFNIDAAGRGHGEVVHRIALAVGVHISRAKFALVQNVINVLIFVAVILNFFLLLLPFLFDELERDFFGNRMAGVISSLHTNLRRVALIIEIAFRISVRDRFPARANE